jgi:hypothetical protein
MNLPLVELDSIIPCYKPGMIEMRMPRQRRKGEHGFSRFCLLLVRLFLISIIGLIVWSTAFFWGYERAKSYKANLYYEMNEGIEKITRTKIDPYFIYIKSKGHLYYVKDSRDIDNKNKWILAQ